jgi:hypothetical protein
MRGGCRSFLGGGGGRRRRIWGGTFGFNLFTFANRNIISAIPSINHNV